MSIKPSADSDAGLHWFKSSYSSNDGPECVEVASATSKVYVRDSKDKQSPHLTFSAAQWSAFVAFAADLR